MFLIRYNLYIMDNEILDLIKEKKLIEPGQVVGVAVSGGIDSMALLFFLNNYAKELKCRVVAITVDHMLRGERSLGDAIFVKNWCRENNIVCYKYSVDAKKIAESQKLTIEEGARIARYEVFNNLLNEGTVDKIALAHHMSDQAETILLHILRGSGLNGACGMDFVRDDNFIRPFLSTTKDEIIKYCSINSIEHIEDETNADNKYNRNYLRNVVIPALKRRWPTVEQSLVSFGKCCKEDNDFILNNISHGGVIVEENVAKIPIIYFHYDPSVINRIIFDVLQKLKASKDIEKKHIEIIKSLSTGENGKKFNLPNNLTCQKEYDYVTLYIKNDEEKKPEVAFSLGNIKFGDKTKIIVKKVKADSNLEEGQLYFDLDKLPKECVFRTRQNGDKFTKYGGGTKSLKNYLIDKKIPSRTRDLIPVLADKNEILIVLGVEISEKIKVDENTKNKCVIEVKESKK